MTPQQYRLVQEAEVMNAVALTIAGLPRLCTDMGLARGAERGGWSGSGRVMVWVATKATDGAMQLRNPDRITNGSSATPEAWED